MIEVRQLETSFDTHSIVARASRPLVSAAKNRAGLKHRGGTPVPLLS
jgi:hypothetical protein